MERQDTATVDEGGMPTVVSRRLLPYVADLAPSDYVGEDHPAPPPDSIDCAFGVSPFGYSPAIDPARLALGCRFDAYPPFPYDSLKDAIIAHWASVADLRPGNVNVCAGSMKALALVAALFIGPGSRVLGVVPQFPEFLHLVAMRGGSYTGIPLPADEDYRFDVRRVVAEIHSRSYTLVYLDNPNNPTGQVISAAAMEQVAIACSAAGAILVVDEAYGDYMSPGESAVSLLGRFPGLVVVRSFSKAYALPGMRIGYALAQEELSHFIRSVDDYLLNPLGLEAAAIALSDRDHLRRTITRTADVKREILAGLTGLRASATDDRVPIMLITHPDRNFDVYAALRDVGVVCARGFAGVGVNAVRLRIPAEAGPLRRALARLEEA